MRSRISRLAIVAMLFAVTANAVEGTTAESLRPFARVDLLPVRGFAPPEAVRAVEEGRYFHASLMLRDYLASTDAPTAEDLLLAARAEAGWGDWARVESLLGRQSWLDTASAGLGRRLLGRSLFELGRWARSIEELDRYLGMADGPTDRDRGFANLWKGGAARGAGDVEAATAAYDRAAALLPEASDWILLESARAAAGAGRPDLVDAVLGRVDPELARDRGWRLRVEAYREADDLDGALEAANRAVAELRSSSARAAALVSMGRLRLERGDTDGARSAFRRALELSSRTTAGIDAARFLTDLPGLTAEDQLRIGRTYLAHGNTQRAVTGLQAWLDSGSGTAVERERVRYDISSAWFRSGDYDDCERVLLGIVERNINRSLAAEAFYLAARCQYRDRRITQSRRTFVEVAERYPDEDAAARAMYLSADLDHDDGEIARATERYRRATTMSPDVEEVGLAHMRLGGLAVQRGDWEAAVDEFDGYRRRYPNGRRYVQATYWSALASNELGNSAAAEDRLAEVLRLDPLSFYGARARELLGRSFWDMPLGATPETSAAIATAVDEALARLDLLLELGWSDAANYEIDRIRQQFAASRTGTYKLAEELNARGFTMIGIAIGWDLFRRDGGWNERLLRIIYPFPYREIIVAESIERGVDPFLAAGLIRQESMFNPAAVSGAGAVGLMQVLPATGRTLARQLGLDGFNRDMLKHAELNAHLGTRYLAEQLADFDGRLPVVLAAYNAGPQRIDRWSQFPEFGDDEQFAERIPFAETRDYVKIVQNNATIYRELYSNAIEALSAGSH
jgi:soluble lytic murein transglycosylase